MYKKSVYWRVLMILLICTAVMASAWFFPGLCDKYTDTVFYHMCNGVSRVTGALPFALGEILMFAGAAAVVLAVIFLILLIFLRRSDKYRRFCAVYYKTLLMTVVCTVFIYMPTWYIPFCGTVLGKGETDARTEYSINELRVVLKYAADGGNAAAEEIAISPDGKVDFPTEEESLPLIADAMRSLADEYPLLDGYYPPVKSAVCSDILERMWIGGYNYPFTFEPTRNKYTSPLDRLETDAHELAHHKGYFKENEAEFLSFLALSKSPDPYLRLVGFGGIYDWVFFDYEELRDEIIMNDVQRRVDSGELNIHLPLETVEEMKTAEKVYKEYLKDEPGFSEHFHEIWRISTGIEMERYEEEHHIIDDMPALDAAIAETAEAGWDIQSEILEDNTYDGAELLILQYFDGKLY